MRISTKLVLLLAGLLGGTSVSATLAAGRGVGPTGLAAAVAASPRGAALVSGALTPLPPASGAATFSLFPNPSRGLVTATLSEPQPGLDYKLRLRNIIGQEVRTVALRPTLSASLTLDFSDLPAGLYLYSLLVDNKAVLTKRLTLQ